MCYTVKLASVCEACRRVISIVHTHFECVPAIRRGSLCQTRLVFDKQEHLRATECQWCKEKNNT